MEGAELGSGQVHFYDTYYRCSRAGYQHASHRGERMNTLKLVVLGSALLFGLAGICRAVEPTVDVLRNQVFVERDSGPLAADVYRPRGAGPFPGMLVVHGGAWRMGARADLATIANGLAEHGYTAVAIDYRLAPTYKFPAQIYDCQAAVRWMRSHASELKIDPTRIGGFGYSAGGHLVALLGTLDEKELREPGIPANAPSDDCRSLSPAAHRATFESFPATANESRSGSAARGTKCQTNIATPRRPASSRPMTRPCISFTASRICWCQSKVRRKW